jgi:hypothetical protein
MIDIDNIDRTIARLAALNNLTLEDAEEAFWIIGDRPFVDAEGRAVVTLEDGRTLSLLRDQ